MKFTPGPWHLVKRDLMFRVRAESMLAHDHSIALVPQTAPANANLIAAAPEMYSALDELAGSLRSWSAELVGDNEDHKTLLNTLIEHAERALAKARGNE